jgi:hypothetical protein
MCVFVFAERRIECYVINGKRSLGHEASSSTMTKGLKWEETPDEKKREKELLQNIFHQLGMLLLSCDGTAFSGI